MYRCAVLLCLSIVLVEIEMTGVLRSLPLEELGCCIVVCVCVCGVCVECDGGVPFELTAVLALGGS